MAELKLYRTYRFLTKDPVIDEIRTLIQEEGLMKKLGIVHQLSGVATATLDNWFNGTTVSPQNRTICAVTSSLGYKRTWAKERELNIDKELKIAKAWLKRQEADAGRKSKRKPRGNGQHHEQRAHHEPRR